MAHLAAMSAMIALLLIAVVTMFLRSTLVGLKRELGTLNTNTANLHRTVAALQTSNSHFAKVLSGAQPGEYVPRDHHHPEPSSV